MHTYSHGSTSTVSTSTSSNSSSDNNRLRLYWALVRIFIAVTSTAFFLYFLVTQCKQAVLVDDLHGVVTVNVVVIDWLSANVYVVENTQYLVRNVTILSPNPYSPTDPSSPIYLTLDGLRNDQLKSFELLLNLSELLRSNDMLKGNESAQLELYVDQVRIIHAEGLALAEAAVSSPSFTWSWYFTTLNLWHSLRLFLIDVVSRHVDYEQQEVASYEVSLVSMLYYRENLAMMRDAALLLYVYPSPFHQDRVVEYHKAVQIYAREVSQKIPSRLALAIAKAESIPQYISCIDVLQSELEQLMPLHWNEEEFVPEVMMTTGTTTIDTHNATTSSFNASEWYDCTVIMLHSQREVRFQLRDMLVETMDQYVSQILTGLVLACVGITLEVIAAATLIHQALPVVVLYIRLQKVVKTSQRVSTMVPSSSTKS